MGLSLSLLVSACEKTVRHWLFGLSSNFRLGYKDGAKQILRAASLSKRREEPETTSPLSSGSNNISGSRRLKDRRPELVTLEINVNVVSLEKEKHTGDIDLPHDHKPVALLSLPGSMLFSSPRLIHELDAAATKLQKVYKSYRTRRNLADCAVVVEELWWKALDFVALKQSSVSFYDVQKPETAQSRWARARTRAARVGKGLSKDDKAQKLALQHWLEAIDPRHRYGHNLHLYYDVWFESHSTQPFFYWLDIGDGKEINLEKCPRTTLQRQCIKYLGPKEREEYEVVVENGKLIYKLNRKLVDADDKSKWIFVLSTTRSLYVGRKQKGSFQHSSFLSGAATTTAGRLIAHEGVIEAIWPYSGHYHPTEENFQEFVSFLQYHKVDLTNVKRCAIDDDTPSSYMGNNELSQENLGPTITSQSSAFNDSDKNGKETNTMEVNEEGTKVGGEKKDDFSKGLSCKWCTGAGPRIGCVGDYPEHLKLRALEQVNLSPRPTSVRLTNYGPIPSPRPIPKVKVSPRLSHMGLPSPRTPIPTMS